MAEVKGGYLRPANAPTSSSYNDHRYNRTPPSKEPGTDIGCAYGTTLVAPEDGVISLVDNSTAGAEGRRVSVAHPDGQMTSLIHLSQILVTSGQKVTRGQAIAKSGASAWGKEWGVGAHVHTTLFPTHAHIFGTANTLDFEKQQGADNDNIVSEYVQVVADRQNYLNAARGEKLVVDGRFGPLTKAAIQRYQTYLRGFGYTGAIDGIWGDGTQKAHDKAYAAWVAATQKPAEPQYHNVTLDDIASLGTGDAVKGLQKIANLYLRQNIDGQWGPKSKEGLQRFLNQNYGGSLVAWLRQRWGYQGNDQFGPVMKAALQRANAENLRAL